MAEIDDVFEEEHWDFWDYYDRISKKKPDTSPEEALVSYMRQPRSKWLPTGDKPFRSSDIYSYGEDWPSYPPLGMSSLLPNEVCDQFGEYYLPMHEEEFLTFPLEREQEIVAALTKHGFVCTRDDEAMIEAHG